MMEKKTAGNGKFLKIFFLVGRWILPEAFDHGQNNNL